MRHPATGAAGLLCLALLPATAAAQDGGLFASDRTTLLGDPGGVRTKLGDVGISLGLAETSEVLGNVSGGMRRGADYDGVMQLSLGIDTQKAFGWDGGTFNVSALQLHGRNLSTDNLATLQTASGIEGAGATRLWEAWFQQSFAGGGIDVRLGQQSIDQEFMTSTYSALFVNTAMGWPLLPSVDLYAGGPAYPLSSLGVRLRAQPGGNVTVLAGVFDDNPPGGRFADDSQVRGAERTGLAFDTGTGALFIAEAQYALNPAPADATQPASGLPGTYKLGAWYDTGGFADPGGAMLTRHGNASLYAVADQAVWQPDPKSPRALGLFARAMGAPNDRNLVTFSADAGASLKAPLQGRDNDTLDVGGGMGVLASGAGPKHGDETFVELTYQAQLAPWLLLQPDAQYVFMPGGGVPDPTRPGKRIDNELVLGVRTSVTF